MFDSFFTEARKTGTEGGNKEAFPKAKTPMTRKKKRHFDYVGADEPINSTELSFKVNVFFKILDAATVSIDERFQLLQLRTDVFQIIYCITDVRMIMNLSRIIKIFI